MKDMHSAEITTRSICLRLRPDGIIESRALESWTGTIQLEHARENIKAMESLTPMSRKLLVYMSVGKFDREARRFYANNGPLVDKTGIVAMNSLSWMAANFFMGVNRPSSKIKVFKNEADAIKWLNNADE